MGDTNDLQSGPQSVQLNSAGTSGKTNKTSSHRNRRRVRHKRTKEPANNCAENIKFEFSGLIIPIMNPQFGHVVRKKEVSTTSAPNIDNIYQFTDGSSSSYMFRTNHVNLPHASPLQPLIVHNHFHRTEVGPNHAVSRPQSSSSQVHQVDHQHQHQQPNKPNTTIEPFEQCDPDQKTKRNRHRKKNNSKNGTTNDAPNDRANESLNNSRNQQSKKGKNEDEAQSFDAYISAEQAQQGIENGTLVEGVIRINPKFYKEAYCSQTDRSLQDYCIRSVADRNRALEGDVVALEVLPEAEGNQKTAKVVHIFQQVHTRLAAGYVSLLQGNRKVPTFMPRDHRVPRMNIQSISLPDDFMRTPSRYENHLFMARLLEWNVPQYGIGVIVENLGHESDIKAETRAILLENSIDFSPFPREALEDLPKTYEIPDEEIKRRLDLRNECIFTIDPLTARDLDDAVSIKLLPNQNLEIGVHIADVTHFLKEGTLLDGIVAKRATSTYLVDSVYHMLPQDLCLSCSLLPGRDALAFSVIWEMTDYGIIVSTKFARTVINSCTQLAYEHAQWMIDFPRQSFDGAQLPQIHGDYKPEFIRECVLRLNGLARQMRRRRFDNGALRIDQIKLGFRLDSSGIPEAFFQQEIREANRLIEEFMLLANISVAEKIYDVFPELAFLRRHEEPNSRLLNDVKSTLEVIGMHLDVNTSAQIHESIEKFRTDDFLGVSRFIAINHLLAKPMTRAKYFCSNEMSMSDFHHYALCVPIYTHFTSPIRRYPDVMVHRLLAASLGYREKPDWRVDFVQKIAENCNNMKFNAKRAGEASGECMLAKYVDTHQPFIVEAVVVSVFDRSFDAVVLKTGSVVRVHINDLPDNVKVQVEGFGPDKKVYKIVIIYPEENHQPSCMIIIDIFQIVRVGLKKKPKCNKLDATLIRPVSINVNTNMFDRMKL